MQTSLCALTHSAGEERGGNELEMRVRKEDFNGKKWRHGGKKESENDSY